MQTDSIQISFPAIQGLDCVLNQSYNILNSQEVFTENIEHQGCFKLSQGSSCNIAICGDIGSGKSLFTAALTAHLKVLCNNFERTSILYYSLSEDIQYIKKIQNHMSNKQTLLVPNPPFQSQELFVSHLFNITQDYFKQQNKEEQIELLKQEYKTQKTTLANFGFYEHLKKQYPQVGNFIFLPMLTPLRDENFTREPNFEDSDFMRRCEQIARHIDRYKKLATEKIIPQLRVIVIDSINMFSDITFKRYMINQLFELCKKNNLIGIFTVDSTPPRALGQFTDLSIIRHAADVVIDLKQEYNNGVCEQKMTIAKSQISDNISGELQMRLNKDSLSIFPCLDFWFRVIMENSNEEQSLGNNLHFVSELKNNELKELFFSETYKRMSVLISGPADTNKVPLALLGVCELLNKKTDPNTYSNNSSQENSSICNSEKKSASSIHNNKPDAKTADQALMKSSPKEKVCPQQFMLVSFGGARDNFKLHKDKDCSKSVFCYGEDDSNEELPSYTFSALGKLANIKIHMPSSHVGVTYKGVKYWVSPGNIRATEFIMSLNKYFQDLKGRNISAVLFNNIGYIQSQYPSLYQDIMNNQGVFFRVIQSLLKQWNMDAIFVNTAWQESTKNNFEHLLEPFVTRKIKFGKTYPNGKAELLLSGKDIATFLTATIDLQNFSLECKTQ